VFYCKQNNADFEEDFLDGVGVLSGLGAVRPKRKCAKAGGRWLGPRGKKSCVMPGEVLPAPILPSAPPPPFSAVKPTRKQRRAYKRCLAKQAKGAKIACYLGPAPSRPLIPPMVAPPPVPVPVPVPVPPQYAPMPRPTPILPPVPPQQAPMPSPMPSPMPRPMPSPMPRPMPSPMPRPTPIFPPVPVPPQSAPMPRPTPIFPPVPVLPPQVPVLGPVPVLPPVSILDRVSDWLSEVLS